MESAQFFSFSDLPFRPLNPKVSSRMMVGEELMFVEHRVKKGHRSSQEKHVNEQLTLVLEGHLRFTVEGKVYDLKAGDALLIPSGADHQAEAVEDSKVIEVFSPPRQEWISLLK